MKTIVQILRSGLIAIALVIASCEKSDTEIDLTDDTQIEEGFKSQTENSDSENDKTRNYLDPLLHKRYDAALTQDEAKALFQKEVSEFMEAKDRTGKLASYVFFEVLTKTGTRAHSQTDGRVVAAVSFLTDQGLLHTPIFGLNNEGDDRENGSWDFYYYGLHAPAISWLKANIAALGLRGKDGWFVEYFIVRANSRQYYNGASGSTSLYSRPRIWLDNTTSDGWDYYNTGNIGQGRLNF